MTSPSTFPVPSPVSSSSSLPAAGLPDGSTHAGRISVTRVPPHQRLGFLPKAFGPRAFLRGEMTVYAWMQQLCDAYNGGFWEFYELGNGGFYMAPNLPGPLRLVCDGNGFDDEVSADAAGVIATLFAISHLMHDGQYHLIDAWDRLREHVYERPDGGLILAAID